VKFCAIVRLDDVDAEREPTAHFIDELDGGPLVAAVIHSQHSNVRAIVDGRELIQSLLGARFAPRDRFTAGISSTSCHPEETSRMLKK
jgi:hypothetical protein